MSRVLLLLPSATYRAPDFLAAATRLGAEVVVGSEHRQAMSGSMGDRAVVLSLGKPERAAEQIEALAARAPVDAIVAADDGGTRAAAQAAARLGLRGNPPEAVARARDKSLMREALAAAGVRQPDYRVTGADGDVAALAAELGTPVVVKPLTLSASRGVIRADSPEEADTAARRVRAILDAAGEDPAGTLLVERFVPGAEVAVEGLLRGGRLQLLAIFDKPDPLEGPYFEETIYVTPSRLDTRGVEEATARAAAALGLREGPIHAELRLDGHGGEPTVLELAARSIGGLCSRSLRFGLGVSLEELILRHALGMTLGDALRREELASGVMMLPIPRRGVLREVGGQDEARAVPGIAGVEITIPAGRPVVPLPEGDRYLGFMFAKGTTPEAVETALREAHARLDVRIEPE